jgi:hypothetical protein
MSRQSPWDCPFCGRMSREEPGTKFKRGCHRVDETRGGSGNWQVICWFCGARGPLSLGPKKALERWMHLADRDGAPKW